MTFWEKVKKDLRKGIEDIDWGKISGEVQLGISKGIRTVRKGAKSVKEKASELTEEAGKQYKILELKWKVRDWIAELGGKVYELSSTGKTPMNATTVQLIISRIRKLEAQIARLEGKPKKISPNRNKRVPGR